MQVYIIYTTDTHIYTNMYKCVCVCVFCAYMCVGFQNGTVVEHGRYIIKQTLTNLTDTPLTTV